MNPTVLNTVVTVLLIVGLVLGCIWLGQEIGLFAND